MEIWDSDKLILFIAFVIPGFVSIRAYDLLFPGNYEGSSKKLIDAITYSCVNYALLWIPIYWVENHDVTGFSYTLFYFLVLFVAPIGWVYLWKIIRETKQTQSKLPHPVNKAWDYVFSKREECWVIVTLKDGTKLAG